MAGAPLTSAAQGMSNAGKFAPPRASTYLGAVPLTWLFYPARSFGCDGGPDCARILCCPARRAQLTGLDALSCLTCGASDGPLLAHPAGGHVDTRRRMLGRPCAAAVYSMLLVCCCWGLTNPLLKQGSQGIEAIKRGTRIGQVASEVRVCCRLYRTFVCLRVPPCVAPHAPVRSAVVRSVGSAGGARWMRSMSASNKPRWLFGCGRGTAL